MKANIIILMTCALTMLSGCAEMCWYHPTKSLEEAIKDCRECDYDADKAVAAVDSGIAAGVRGSSLFNSCMQSRGYGCCKLEELPAGLRAARVPVDNINRVCVAGK